MKKNNLFSREYLWQQDSVWDCQIIYIVCECVCVFMEMVRNMSPLQQCGSLVCSFSNRRYVRFYLVGDTFIVGVCLFSISINDKKILKKNPAILPELCL